MVFIMFYLQRAQPHAFPRLYRSCLTLLALFPLPSGVDPTTVAVLMEDGGAIVGLIIAGD